MPDEAVIDAPVEEVAAIDTAVSTEVETPSIQVDEPSGESQPTDAGESLRGSALWREVKSLTQEGKPLTPKQLSALNKVIHKNDTFESKYPEGLSHIEGQLSAVKQLIDDESVPFEQAIEQTLQERNYFRELDNLFTNGKPEFVEKMAEASPESFENIAPAVFRKYAEMNPDGYSKYVAQAVVSHMSSAGVPMQFQVLEAFWPQVPDFPGKAQFQKALASVMDWTDALKGMAAKEVAPKAIPNQQNGQPPADQEAQLADREQKITIQEWNASISSQSINFVMTEAAKAAGKVTLTEAEKQTVLAKVKEEYSVRLQMNKDYDQAARGYVKAGNRSAYIQRVQSEQKKLIPGAVRRAVADVLEARPKASSKQPAQAGKPVDTGKKTAGAPLQGAVQYRRIAGPPRTLGMEVDLNRTSSTMLQRRQAYLKGQQNPVTWAVAK